MYQVKNGKQVVPTCSECGCRLFVMQGAMAHFYGDTEYDARGCLCSQYHVVILIEENMPQTKS